MRTAVLFDLDGTLLDSEGVAERAVEALMAAHGVDAATVDAGRYKGVTWASVEADLRARFGVADVTAERMSAHFDALAYAEWPPPIGGAAQARRAAAESCRVALVTSGNRPWADRALAELGLTDVLTTRVTAEDVTRSKPDPQPYLIGAERLGVAPERCLVFEDSVAGVAAGRAAGMTTVGIGRDGDFRVADYTDLPARFFATWAASPSGFTAGAGDFAGLLRCSI